MGITLYKYMKKRTERYRYGFWAQESGLVSCSLVLSAMVEQLLPVANCLKFVRLSHSHDCVRLFAFSHCCLVMVMVLLVLPLTASGSLF